MQFIRCCAPGHSLLEEAGAAAAAGNALGKVSAAAISGVFSPPYASLGSARARASVYRYIGAVSCLAAFPFPRAARVCVCVDRASAVA